MCDSLNELREIPFEKRVVSVARRRAGKSLHDRFFSRDLLHDYYTNSATVSYTNVRDALWRAGEIIDRCS